MRSTACITALAVLVASTAHGDVATPGGAVDAVRDTLDKARAVVLTDQYHEQKLAALHDLARHLMDTREM